jgi:hypothetical protein
VVARPGGTNAIASIERISAMTSFASLARAAYPKRRWQLIALGLLYGLLTPIGLLAAWVALFFFDAPGSERDPTVWFLAISTWMLPVTLVTSGVGCLLCAFIRPSTHQSCAVWVFTWLPILNLLVLGIAIGLGVLAAAL